MDFEKDIVECLRVLQSGGLILYPTDTIWGIGCDATNAEAVEKIYRLKKRNDEKALIVLVADEREILRHVAAPDPEIFDYLQQVTKPTTVIYDGAIGLAANLVSANGSIAIRICREDFCRQLIKRFRRPVVSTSANLSGEPSPKFFKQIKDEIKTGVDYVVRFRQDDERESEPSSIIRWHTGGPPTIIR